MKLAEWIEFGVEIFFWKNFLSFFVVKFLVRNFDIRIFSGKNSDSVDNLLEFSSRIKTKFSMLWVVPNIGECCCCSYNRTQFFRRELLAYNVHICIMNEEEKSFFFYFFFVVRYKYAICTRKTREKTLCNNLH